MQFFELRDIRFLRAEWQLAVMAVLFIATIFVVKYFAVDERFLGMPISMMTLLAPLYEEVIFRGLIFGWFARRYDWRIGLIASSLLFGVWHLKNIFWLDTPSLIAQMAWAGLFIGPLLAFVTHKTKSIWPSVIIHQINNIWAPISFVLVHTLKLI